jgi:guanylate kinase
MGIFGKIKKGLIFVLSAPSGAGKTTLVERLILQFPQAIARSVSCTTRAKRSNEQEGVDYFFVTKEEFEKKIVEGAFLEYTQVYRHYYGTLKKTVEDTINQGKHLFLVIDTQGAMKLRSLVKAHFIFIKPPSIEVLKERLEKRHTDDSSAINVRLSCAQDELSEAIHYDKIIINDELETAVAELCRYVATQEKLLCEYI